LKTAMMAAPPAIAENAPTVTATNATPTGWLRRTQSERQTAVPTTMSTTFMTSL
jgi:hypothetical protein